MNDDIGNFWGGVPVYVLQDHRHKAAHLRVLAAILSCPAPYYPSLETIGKRSGHTPKYCSNIVSQMVGFGTIERDRRHRNSNVYRLVGAKGISNGMDTSSTTVMDSDSTTIVEQKESLKEKHTIQSFGYFCKIYPRHRLGNWKNLRAYWISNDLELKGKEICDAINEFKLSGTEGWGKDNGRYVPNAMKFLEEEKWTVFDETYDPMKEFEED